MKNIILLRLFITFPIIGIALPDAAFCFTDKKYHIPLAHFAILGTLMVIFLVSFAFRHRKAEDKENLSHN